MVGMGRHVLAIACGVLTWTLLEYVIHRWMGHDRRFRKSPFGVEHIRHHIEGNYFAPTYKKLLAAALAAPIVATPAILLVGFANGALYTVGMLAFYGMYELLHRRHHTHAGFGAYGRFLRRHHFHHHFVDGRVNHGVTSPLWDFVFRTYDRPSLIRVPRKLCMSWLIDPATGDIHAAHAQTYQLR
jgi:sterol desaturase/sphingolipid hydroxylase (fatty acid hydroxylase superfamily)